MVDRQLPMSVIRRVRCRDERGVVLAVAAIILTALLAMSALAVDLGALYNERRNDQAAADAASLAAAQDLPDVAAAVVTAKSVAASNLGEPISDAQWNSCSDATAYPVPTGFARRVGATCIAVDSARRRVMVRIPVREYETAFANIVGLSSFEHSAFAVAGVTIEGFGGVLPFALSPGGGAFTCIERGGGNVAGNDSDCRQTSAQPGNFGALDFSWFGNGAVGTSTSCSTHQTDQVNRFANNVALGVDHDLLTIGVTPRQVDTTACTTGGPLPNSAGGNNGSSFDSLVGQGLYSGGTFSDGLGPRLTRLGAVSGTPPWMTARTNIAGASVDDIALWEFLPTTSVTTWDVPRSCWRDQFESAVNPLGPSSSLPSGVATHLAQFTGDGALRDRLFRLTERCLVHYEGLSWDDSGQLLPSPGDPPCSHSTNTVGSGDCSANPSQPGDFTDAIFIRDSDPTDEPALYDIQYSPRFGYVPETTDPVGNSTPADIVSFRAVFIQRLYGACSAHGSSCGLLFDPGVGYSLASPPSNLQGATEAVGVFTFPQGSLPAGLADEGATVAINANRFVELVR